MEIKMKSRYSVYPAYKDSGVEWVGKIPEHWEVNRLKYCCSINPNIEKTNLPIDELEVSFLPMESIGIGTVNLSQIKKFAEVNKGFTYFIDDDVVVAKITPCFENGKGAIVRNLFNGIGYGTTELHVLRVNNNLDNRFLYYITASYPFRKIAEGEMQGTAGQKRVTEQFVRNFPAILPPLSEQRAIADFLDRHTARIDALIAKYQRLIELLEEKRTSLISQAVTKGLDASVEMKDSGVEWLGSIPSHWKVKKLKMLVSKIGSGKTPRGGSEVYCNEGIIFIRSQNVYFDGLHLDDVVYIDNKIDEEMHSTRVQVHDVLLNITGASLGRVAIVPENLPRANVNQHVAIIRPKAEVIFPQFLKFVIESQVIQAQIFSTENGAAREGLPYSKMANLLLAMPVKIEEQIEISKYLDQQMKQLTCLLDKIDSTINCLREYRTALISAAVTGKIDVTN